MRYIKQRSIFSPYVPRRLLSILFFADLVIVVMSLARSTPSIDFKHPQPGFYVAMVMSIVGPIISGVLCMKGSFWHLRHPASSEGSRQTQRFSPLLWGLSGYIYAVGQVIWLGQVLLIGQMPGYPSAAHFIELLTYGCFIAAILFLPTHSISSLARLRILLDSLIIMAAVTTLCYYFVLAPLMINGRGTQLARSVGGLYPVLDLLAMFSVLVVALRSGERVLRPVLIMLGLAAALQFVVNVLHLYEILYRDYNEFSVAGATMVVYGTLLVGAAQTVNTILRKGETAAPSVMKQGDVVYTDTPWKVVLPSVLVLVFGLLIFMIWLNGAQAFPGQIVIVYIGGFVVLILMVLRQFLTMYQIDCLQMRLKKKNRSLDVLNTQLEKQATTDPLTDLPNHRALAEKLDEILKQAWTMAVPCSVIFMDIDHFKAMNDCYGHLIGDVALGYIAQVVKSTVRVGDAVGRWGGEEFVAILPGAGFEEAFQVAERIRVAVHQVAPGYVGVPGLSCSLGVATYPHDASEREDLIRRADKAMYEAKRLGRNQVRVAHELAGGSAVRKAEGGAEASMFEIAEALLLLVEARDPSLSRHARRVAALTLRLAQEMGLSRAEARVVALGGLLHNLGDIALADEFLFKRGQLSAGEHEGRGGYPVAGAKILAPIPALRSIATIIHAHCEQMDGSGYPAGLKGEEIPLGARIVAVASAYDVALDTRSSRSGRASVIALKEVSREAGSRFDPQVIEALQRVLAVSPILSRIDVA